MNVSIVRSKELLDEAVESVLRRGSVFRGEVWHRALAESLGYEPAALVVTKGTGVVSALPLCIGRDLFSRRVAVSLPFTAGLDLPNAENGVGSALLARSAAACRTARIDRLELRLSQALGGASRAHGDNFSFELTLDGTREEILRRSSADHRRRLNLVTNAGRLRVREDDDVGPFYGIYTRRLKQLGSPAPPRRMFELIRRRFGSAVKILTAMDGHEPIASMFLLQSATRMHFLWGAALTEYHGLHVNHLLYRYAIDLAHQRGLAAFDFGRSNAKSGVCRFKKQFGALPVPLYYYRFNRLGNQNYRMQSQLMSVGSTVWRTLPSWATDAASAFVTRAIFP